MKPSIANSLLLMQHHKTTESAWKGALPELFYIQVSTDLHDWLAQVLSIREKGSPCIPPQKHDQLFSWIASYWCLGHLRTQTNESKTKQVKGLVIIKALAGTSSGTKPGVLVLSLLKWSLLFLGQKLHPPHSWNSHSLQWSKEMVIPSEGYSFISLLLNINLTLSLLAGLGSTDRTEGSDRQGNIPGYWKVSESSPDMTRESLQSQRLASRETRHANYWKLAQGYELPLWFLLVAFGAVEVLVYHSI